MIKNFLNLLLKSFFVICLQNFEPSSFPQKQMVLFELRGTPNKNSVKLYLSNVLRTKMKIYLKWFI